MSNKGTRTVPSGGLRLNFADANASKSGQTPKSANKTKPQTSVTQQGSGNQAPETLSRRSNRLYQEAKTQLEQSKMTTKESVISKLTSLYDCVLEYQEAAQRQHVEIERLKAQMTQALLEKETEHCIKLEQTTSSFKQFDVSAPVLEVTKEIKAIRDIISFDVIGKLDVARRENAAAMQLLKTGTGHGETTNKSTQESFSSNELIKQLTSDLREHKQAVKECNKHTSELTLAITECKQHTMELTSQLKQTPHFNTDGNAFTYA
ncbi:hypothetical protein O0L34_g8078 [Tuta absoluta]|nr:hypothetical protein O0L34_g8078 [Tuta absoluta]